MKSQVMKNKASIKLNLTDQERRRLRKNKIKISELTDFTPDELRTVLETDIGRAKELFALADFQRIPSVGIEFAKDLIFLGYYAVEELKYQNGAQLREEYELKKGYQIDSCVEDQFRLVVHFARTDDYSKNWWDFTTERKKYRLEHGYPENRPKTIWTEVLR